MKKLISVIRIITLCIITAIPVKAQYNKLANTLLWEISGKGLTKPSYLFGTMHVSNKIAFHLQDSFFIAISNVDYVALELNPENWLKDMLESKTYKEMEDFQQNSGYFSANPYNKLVNINFLKQIHYKQALVDNNQIINQLLYRITNNPFLNNYEEDTYLDLYIYQTGKKLNKKVAGLENFDQSIQMLIRAMLPDEKDSESSYNPSSYMNAGNIQEKMENAYRRQNILELDSLSRLTNPSKNYHKYLIVERNKIMLRSMDSLMKLGSIFTGVGAAHLPGKEGLINLLIENGYQVKPVLGRETSVGKKIRDKLEEKNVAKATQSFIFNDSIFQYTLPDKILEVTAGFGPVSHIYPDMANGSYYSASRVPHFAHFLNKNEHFLKLQLDSILYESIPGKIVVKKEITSNNGYPGFELISKLNNGKMMQFLIYFTPLEIIFIKAGGPQRAYKSSEWIDFFRSLKFLNDNVGMQWTRYNAPYGEFNANIPAIHTVYSSDKNENKDLMLLSFDNTDSSYYQINAVSLDDINYLEDDTFEYYFLSEKLATEINAELLNRKFIDTQYGKALDAEYKLKSLNVKTRFAIHKNRYFLMSAMGKDNKNWDRFLGSLQFNNPSVTNFTLIDSTMHFKTLSDKEVTNTKSFMETLRDIVLESKLYEKDFKQDFIVENKTYSSATSPSTINVKIQKLSKYDIYEKPDSLWNEEKKMLQIKLFEQVGNYIATPPIKITENPKINKESYTYFTIKDSAAKQAVLIKKVLANDHIFTLSTLIDTLQGMDKWQELFYGNFEPWDTCKIFSISQPKDSLFLADLQSTDSASFASAISTELSFKLLRKYPSLTDSIIKFVGSNKFKTKPNDDKVKIIQLLGDSKIEKEKLYNALENLYIAENENPELQFALLNVLVKQKTPVSYGYIKKWLNTNLPLTTDDDDVSDFFDSLKDSLDLCKSFYPDFLKFMQFPEYKNPVIKLLADLVIHNKVNTSAWISEKSILLRDAQVELKRYNSENLPKNNDKENDDEDDYRFYDVQKITSSLPWLDNKGPNELASYSVILTTISETDVAAKQIIDKVLKTGHRGLIFSISLAQYRLKQNVNDTIWTWFAADDNSRMHFLDWIELTNDTNLYPQKYYNQDAMSLSWLMDAHTSKKKDSLQVIGKYYVSNVLKSGYLYFYKYKIKDKWYLNYVGLQSADTTKVLSDYSYYKYSGIVIDPKKENEIKNKINEIRKSLRLKGRQRVSGSFMRNRDLEVEDEAF